MPYFIVVWREICVNCAAAAITSARGQAGASEGLGGNATLHRRRAGNIGPGAASALA
jgi:hypothetical protein